MKEHWQTAIVALVLALCTWYVVTGREKVETWIHVPIEMIGASDDVIIHDGLVNQIEVRVRGPKELVRSLKAQEIGYPLDISGLQAGVNSIELIPSLIDISGAYEIMEMRPAHLLLTADRMITKTVPVSVKWPHEKDLNPDYMLKKMTVSPENVQLLGPESSLKLLDKVDLILEETFKELVPSHWSSNLPIVLDSPIKASPSVVRIDLSMGPKLQTIPVKLRKFTVNAPQNFTVSVLTNSVTLEVEGPVFLFRNDEFRKEIGITAFVKSGIAPGKQKILFAVKLPDGCRLVRATPEILEAVVKIK